MYKTVGVKVNPSSREIFIFFLDKIAHMSHDFYVRLEAVQREIDAIVSMHDALRLKAMSGERLTTDEEVDLEESDSGSLYLQFLNEMKEFWLEMIDIDPSRTRGVCAACKREFDMVGDKYR